jgi:hypothetical protein
MREAAIDFGNLFHEMHAKEGQRNKNEGNLDSNRHVLCLGPTNNEAHIYRS